MGVGQFICFYLQYNYLVFQYRKGPLEINSPTQDIKFAKLVNHGYYPLKTFEMSSGDKWQCNKGVSKNDYFLRNMKKRTELQRAHQTLRNTLKFPRLNQLKDENV